MNRFRMMAVLFALLIAVLLAACGGSDAESPAAEAEATEAVAQSEVEEAVEEAAEEEEAEAPAEAPVGEESAASGDRIPIRWFVGLGTGAREDLQQPQLDLVEEFNASQDRIHLTVEFINTDQATDVLNTQIAAGNAPDIVGPMGTQGRERFRGAWMDLGPMIEETGYDLGDFDPALVEFYEVGDQGQVGIPFAIFPSFTLYNKELFDEAGLPYPPQEYGAPYIDENGEEQEWNVETLAMLAQKLTVDENGNDATSPEFDPEAIVQFGWGNQFADLRAGATLFGPGNFVDEEGNAVIPEHWVDAFRWYHSGMWEQYFIPNGPYGSSALMGEGNWFESGNLAMANAHLWYPNCCMGGYEGTWDIAAVPSANGQTTAKLHADTFGIMDSTDHPAEAFEVLSFLVGPAADELTTVYGGMPARLSLQDSYFDKLAEQFPEQEVNWDVVVAGIPYSDSPHHEAWMPNFLEAEARYGEFNDRLNNEPDLDIDAAVAELQEDLQAIFDMAGGQ